MPCQVADGFGLQSIQYLRSRLVRLQMVLAYTERSAIVAMPLTAVPYALLFSIIQSACFAPVPYLHCKFGRPKHQKQLFAETLC
jgi:hypothetical protein